MAVRMVPKSLYRNVKSGLDVGAEKLYLLPTGSHSGTTSYLARQHQLAQQLAISPPLMPACMYWIAHRSQACK